MLDVKFIRENQELVERSAKEKGYNVDIQALLAIDDKRKAELVQVEELRKKRNEIPAPVDGIVPEGCRGDTQDRDERQKNHAEAHGTQEPKDFFHHTCLSSPISLFLAY